MDAKVSFFSKPSDFKPSVEAAVVFIEHAGKYLHLKRSKEVFQGGTWCIPGGKLEKGESAEKAVLREVYEEVSIELDPVRLESIGQFHIRLASQGPDLDYTLHVYHQVFNERPACVLSNEHCAYEWLSIEEIVSLPLIAGHLEVVNTFSLSRCENESVPE